MKNFMKVTVLSKKRVKYNVSGNGYISREKSGRFVIPETRRDIVLNLDEVAMAEKTSLETLDTDVVMVGEESKICLKDDPKRDLFSPDELAKLKYDCPYGVVILKNGVKTNLGLNGMDVDQTLVLVEESYDRLERALLG